MQTTLGKKSPPGVSLCTHVLLCLLRLKISHVYVALAQIILDMNSNGDRGVFLFVMMCHLHKVHVSGIDTWQAGDEAMRHG